MRSTERRGDRYCDCVCARRTGTGTGSRSVRVRAFRIRRYRCSCSVSSVAYTAAGVVVVIIIILPLPFVIRRSPYVDYATVRAIILVSFTYDYESANARSRDFFSLLPTTSFYYFRYLTPVIRVRVYGVF